MELILRRGDPMWSPIDGMRTNHRRGIAPIWNRVEQQYLVVRARHAVPLQRLK